MRKMVKDRGHTLKAQVVEKTKGEDKKPLVATFGGISLAWNKHVLVNGRPRQVYSGRNKVVHRFLTGILLYRMPWFDEAGAGNGPWHRASP